MPRIARLSPRFHARHWSLEVSGATAVAVARTIAALTREPLPGPQDRETMMPPVARYWFRRVPDHNLWIYFAFSETELVAVTLSARPPIPLEE
jgi:hypothetical protein